MSENGVQNGAVEFKAEKSAVEEKQENVSIPAPTFGFTEKGTFYLEVDLRLGFFTILGTLTRAISYVNGALNQQEAKMREMEKQKSLLKPKANGSTKWLNIFK